jgi:hypothetical protein
MAVSGGHIWMTDGGCQIARVTISSDQGRIFRLPRRDCQGYRLPAQISVAGGNVWVGALTHSFFGSMAELNARNGHLVRFISGRKYRWIFPSFVVAGPDLWVTSTAGGFHGRGSVTELRTSTGSLVHVFSGGNFDHPSAIAAWGSHVWVMNRHSVIKL